MENTITSPSNSMTLVEVISHLANTDMVDGVALFGSLSTNATDVVSDYDLLVMVANPPVQIFQLQTYIDGRIADIAFVETDVADRVLALENPVPETSNEGFLIGWLEYAQIVYDGKSSPGMLSRIQQKLMVRDWRLPSSESDIYADWFWLNFDLRHMKRMAASGDAIYQITADIHLITNLAQLWRAYCHTHGVHWRGVKAMARYLQAHDPNYLTLFQWCLVEPNRKNRLALYEKLVGLTLVPSCEVWPADTTAVVLKNPSEQPERIGEALAFWEHLIV